MIQETELNLFVPSPELLVRLASGNRPLGISAGPPRIRLLRETYFDTPEGALRRRAMTCKLKQGEGEVPQVVVTVGEGPDSEGITSRSRLTASAVGLGIFETLRGDSEVAAQVQKFVDPRELRPEIALDIQRLGRVHRRGLFRTPVLYLFFDRITVQARGSSSVLHELRIRRRRPGGPLILDLAKGLRDEFHLFPDGQSTLQRADRVLALERKGPGSLLSPYALSLALAVFRDGKLGLVQRSDLLCIPTFRGSGEDAAWALAADLIGTDDHELARIGVTEPREGRQAVEVWVAPDPPSSDGTKAERNGLVWIPWHALLEMAGKGGIRDQDLLATLLLLTRKRLLGQMEWIPSKRRSAEAKVGPQPKAPLGYLPAGSETTEVELQAADALLTPVRVAENLSLPLEERLGAVSEFSEQLKSVFAHQIKDLKGEILTTGPEDDESGPVLLLDLLSVRIRGLMDRVYDVVNGDLLPGLEEKEVFLRSWAGLMHEDRRALLKEFSRLYLPELEIVADWGPAFVPEMPPGGGAVGLTARVKGSEVTRFFHVVLGKDTPAFIPVPGSAMALSLEEVIRGLLFSEYPELEKAETHLFRFSTAEVKVRELVQTPIVTPPPGTAATQVSDLLPLTDEPLPPPEPTYEERAESVVTEVLVHSRMPENHQVQLLRALERQVTRRSPLIGWSDLYIVDGPLDLSGLGDLFKLG
jgi:hypothetical protein